METKPAAPAPAPAARQTDRNPFGSPRLAVAGGAAAAEAAAAREVAEVTAMMMMARRFPRDEKGALDRILTACTRGTLAEDSVYQYARGGSDVSGPSIRLAEVVAQNWGNIDCGVKELSRHEGYSEVMAYAIDLETGFRDAKLFQVRHWRDTRQGGYAAKDERDVYEIIANQGARRKRACILAVIPADIVDEAVRQCEITVRTTVEINAESIKDLVATFAKIGVTKAQIEKRIQRGIESITPALWVQLRRIFGSVRDGMSDITDWFEPEEAAAAEPPKDPLAAAAASAAGATVGAAATAASATGKPGGKGTAEKKADIVKRMGDAKDAAALSEIAEEANTYDWSKKDHGEINTAYFDNEKRITGPKK